MIYTMTLNPAVDRELTVPTITFDTVLRASSARVDCGGKGFNVSRMLAELGGRSTALGFAGGRSGELLRDGLETLDIQTEFVWIEAETRTNVSIVTEAHDHHIKVNEAGPAISDEAQQALVDQVRDKAKAGDWWVLAGSLPPRVPADFYADLIAILRAAGAYTLLDTSGSALAAGCEAGPSLVKPNDIEAHALTQLPVETISQRVAAAQAIRAKGTDTVVMSLGKAGALLVTAEGAWQASSPSITEQNPIGAGDSMVGGIIWALSEGAALPEALRWGIACGAGTASMAGTSIGGRELVHTLFKQIQVTPVGVD